MAKTKLLLEIILKGKVNEMLIKFTTYMINGKGMPSRKR